MSYVKYEEHLQRSMRDRALLNSDFSAIREMNKDLAEVLHQLEEDFRTGRACVRDMLDGLKFAVQRLRGSEAPAPARQKRR